MKGDNALPTDNIESHTISNVRPIVFQYIHIPGLNQY